KDPQKNLPRAIPLAIMVIALVYIGTILVAMAINPAAIVKTKQVVAITAIFQARWLRILIELGALISMFGINMVIKAKSLIYKHFKNRCTTCVQRFIICPILIQSNCQIFVYIHQ
ncbi:MAG: hypothetical protein HUJ64_07065, partial [Limosilactobacillus mucosae]|nr:hypothetical protein [Limosilactobacillus mucosae]